MIRSALALLTAIPMASASAAEIAADPGALAAAMERHRIVLLGEVHDNAAQHTLRAAALRQLIERGSRPAIAFEQFDRDRQAAVERARHDRPHDADHLIAKAKGSEGWQWAFYRPYVALALEYDLPIVAANLSRSETMRVAAEGWAALFDARQRNALKLDALPADFTRKHEYAIAVGHCNLLPADAIPARAQAQMARDIVLAESIRPYFGRGVVLLAGNGHARRDIGVPFWLTADERKGARSIGLLERDGDNADAESGADFDDYAVTERAERPDPCKELAERLRAAPSR